MAAVLLSDPIAESGLQILQKAGLEAIYLPDAHRQDLLQAAPKVQGWVGRSGTRLDQELLQAAEGLQVIGRAGEAFAVIRVDSPVSEEILQELSAFPEITALRQLHCPRLTSER